MPKSPNTVKVSERLTPTHLDDLRASGLSHHQIVLCGFFSVRTAEEISAILNWTTPAVGLGEALAIPFLDHDGKPTGYCRLKPDHPRKAKDGKPIKYESPVGLSNRAFFPPGTRAALRDMSIPLLITEGEKKAAKADQEGFPCIGLVGVHGWARKRDRDAAGKPIGNCELIDDLAPIPWKDRCVFIVFDSDAATNPDVLLAERRLAEALARQGAIVKIVRLPQW